MRNLVRLAVKYHAVLLFLVLQMLAFSLLFSNNYYHHTSFLNSSNAAVGSLMEVKSSVTDHFDLLDENERLAAENARLRDSLEMSWIMRIRGNSVLVDDTIYHQQYYYHYAHVINRTINKQHNYFTLDKGSLDSIEVDMGVIGPNGIVGFVQNVSANYSTVVLAIHRTFETSVQLKGTDQAGILKWKGAHAQNATFSDIPQHAVVTVGDTVVTTASSGKYPENLPIGVVLDVQQEEGGDYQFATVRLFTDFSSIQNVYVIDNIFRKEQKQLEEETEDAL